MFQTLFTVTALSLAVALSSPLLATAATAGDANSSAATEAPAVALTNGEIKKIDLDAGKMTIQHGPLINLHMPGMTMVFKAKDPAILKTLKTGDKVRFAAESVGGSLVVTTLEKQP
jgi:Cu(I)/Ag(I) efflux system protein CusF